jgi:valyl-tRNA synthetase
VVDEATRAFDNYNYTHALELAESFFWSFCDDHLELVKDRAYGGQGEAAAQSARATLVLALETLLKLFAPFLPFVTEEVWSWFRQGSVHKSKWPNAADLRQFGGDADVVPVVAEVISQLRKVKSEAKVSMKAELATASVTAPPAVLDRLRLAQGDIVSAGRVQSDLRLVEGVGPVVVTATLA